MTQPSTVQPDFRTADLFDRHGERLRIAGPVFRHYGGRRRFCGPVATVSVFEDNTLVRASLEREGAGRVLVVDGAGSLRVALLGDRLAALGAGNGWTGVVIHGCVRDADALEDMDFGVLALATCPAASRKGGGGQADQSVRVAGLTIQPGQYLYADRDGVVLADDNLLAD